MDQFNRIINWKGMRGRDQAPPSSAPGGGGRAPSPLPYNNTGLQKLWVPKDPSKAIADIVFLHGLTGHSYYTWLHNRSNIHWPSSLLCEDVPDIRILSFGYTADVVNFWTPASQNRVGTHAKDLLLELANFREETESEDRPIVIVAHSLGGLVAQNALSWSRANAQRHLNMVGHHIMAMIFLGTPHCGSDLAGWATLGTRIARLLKHANTAIVAVLERDSEVLASIQDNFAQALESRKDEGRRIRITCFAESLPVSGIGLIVPEHSAILRGYEDGSIDANHMEMTKFATREDRGYRAVLGSIRRAVRELRKAADGPAGNEQSSQSDTTAEDRPRGQHIS